MDTNMVTRYTEYAEGLLVRVAPLDRAVKAYVSASLFQELLTLEQDRAHAGHPGVTKMYNSMRRSCYWQAMIADVHPYVMGCATCAKSQFQWRRWTAPLK